MPDSQPTPFRFAYRPGVLRYGVGAAAALGDELAAHGVERALVVSGRTVGATDAVMDPVRDGLGNRLADVFAETTPDKRLSTAIDAADAMAAADADGLVAVGGGSSLDVSTVARIVATSDRDGPALADELRASGTISLPDADLPPLVAVPTTLAGAELSQVAGITLPPDDGGTPFSGGVSDPRLTPSTVLADPELYATTPASVLTGSAMNGFDKGIEALYSRHATPVTDGTAVRGLELLRDGLPAMAEDTTDLDAMGTVVQGTLLVQYGGTRPDAATVSVIHAFGHALRDHAGLQQGVAHAIVAPHALRYVLDEVNRGRDLVAAGLGVETGGKTDDEVADAVVTAVAEVRDSLGLPDSFADVDGVERDDYEDIAELVLEDGPWANAPTELDPTVDDVVGVLELAWDDPRGDASSVDGNDA